MRKLKKKTFKKPLSLKEKIKGLLSDIEKEKNILCETRDNLRQHIYDLEDILETINEAEEKFDYGLDYLTKALESTSELI